MLCLDGFLLLRKCHIHEIFCNHIGNIFNVLTAFNRIDSIDEG